MALNSFYLICRFNSILINPFFFSSIEEEISLSFIIIFFCFDSESQLLLYSLGENNSVILSLLPRFLCSLSLLLMLKCDQILLNTFPSCLSPADTLVLLLIYCSSFLWKENYPHFLIPLPHQSPIHYILRKLICLFHQHLSCCWDQWTLFSLFYFILQIFGHVWLLHSCWNAFFTYSSFLKSWQPLWFDPCVSSQLS